jgi:hypothetical protein
MPTKLCSHEALWFEIESNGVFTWRNLPPNIFAMVGGLGSMAVAWCPNPDFNWRGVGIKKSMNMLDLILRAIVAVLGGGALVLAVMLRQKSLRLTILFFGIAISSIYISGQSVLTSGTATLSAILFIISQWVGRWREYIYKSFFIVFKIIWIGIGLNALYNIGAVFWGWKGIKMGTPAWFFGEALFAVIILNGVYIGKVLGPGIAAILKTGEQPSNLLVRRISASGSVSFVSWYGWHLARKGLLEFWTMSELLSMWLGAILIVFGLTILSETLRSAIQERHPS